MIPGGWTHTPHDYVIKWKHFPRYWPFVRGIYRWSVNSPHKGQWHGALMFSLICAWTKGSGNNRDAGDLRRHRTHYVVTAMPWGWALMRTTVQYGLNPLRPTDGYMRQQNRSSLIQIMACRLCGVKPLFLKNTGLFLIVPLGTNLCEIQIKLRNLETKAFWKCHLQNYNNFLFSVNVLIEFMYLPGMFLPQTFF